MSSDNYFLIRQHPEGGFIALEGFASRPEAPGINNSPGKRFASIKEAWRYASSEFSQYGVSMESSVVEMLP